MERVGRKPKKLAHVEKLTGSEQAKQRLKWILATLSGEATIPQACGALEINESRFHQVRNAWLQDAVGCLEPAPVGRPPKHGSEEVARVAELQQRVARLEGELHVAHLKAELAAASPGKRSSKKSG
jgi:uncharacterized small protein (DUF1192 family)